MATDPIITMFETLNLVLILIAFAIFSRLAIKGKSLGSFRFQLSIFLQIWVISEVPHIGESIGLLTAGGDEDTRVYLHAASIAGFCLFVGVGCVQFPFFPPPPSLKHQF